MSLGNGLDGVVKDGYALGTAVGNEVAIVLVRRDTGMAEVRFAIGARGLVMFAAGIVTGARVVIGAEMVMFDEAVMFAGEMAPARELDIRVMFVAGIVILYPERADARVMVMIEVQDVLELDTGTA